MLMSSIIARRWLATLGTTTAIFLGISLLATTHADDPLSNSTPLAETLDDNTETITQQSHLPSSKGRRLTKLRLPAFLKRLGLAQRRSARPARSEAVLDELQEIYRQNGLQMPPMTMADLRNKNRPVTVETVPPAPATIQTTGQTKPVSKPVSKPVTKPVTKPVAKPVIRRGGLGGKCPVALRDQRKLVDGLSKFSVAHDGRVILLSSAKALATFTARPEAYLPAADGMDLVSIDQQRPRLGTLDYATWYRGRLYLFTPQSNLVEFREQPERYVR